MIFDQYQIQIDEKSKGRRRRVPTPFAGHFDQENLCEFLRYDSAWGMKKHRLVLENWFLACLSVFHEYLGSLAKNEKRVSKNRDLH